MPTDTERPMRSDARRKSITIGRADIGPADIAVLFSGVARSAAVAGDLEKRRARQ
ncbi:MAG: hypothetical protein ABI658_17585 [Acidimicrobiales bacterium]